MLVRKQQQRHQKVRPLAIQPKNNNNNNTIIPCSRSRVWPWNLCETIRTTVPSGTNSLEGTFPRGHSVCVCDARKLFLPIRYASCANVSELEKLTSQNCSILRTKPNHLVTAAAAVYPPWRIDCFRKLRVTGDHVASRGFLFFFTFATNTFRKGRLPFPFRLSSFHLAAFEWIFYTFRWVLFFFCFCAVLQDPSSSELVLSFPESKRKTPFFSCLPGKVLFWRDTGLYTLFDYAVLPGWFSDDLAGRGRGKDYWNFGVKVTRGEYRFRWRNEDSVRILF